MALRETTIVGNGRETHVHTEVENRSESEETLAFDGEWIDEGIGSVEVFGVVHEYRDWKYKPSNR